MSVTVIGLDGSALSTEAAHRLAAARLVVGGRRNLAAVELPPGCPRIELGPLEPALSALAAAEGPAVVLASGDPGFFGIVRALREHGILLSVLPALSSVQRAFAAIGRSWDDAVVVSAHGRELRRAVNVCRARDAVAVFTAPGAGPAELAVALRGWDRTLVIAEDLGGPDERVSAVRLSEAAAGRWREPNLVLSLRNPDFTPALGWISGAFSEPPRDHDDHEVTACICAHLDPRPGHLVWTTGTGAAPLAATCANRGAAVLLAESGRERDANPVPGVRVVRGRLAAGLPQPDSVYVGDSNLATVAISASTVAQRIVVRLGRAEDADAVCDVLLRNGFGTRTRQIAVTDVGASGSAATTPADLAIVVLARR